MDQLLTSLGKYKLKFVKTTKRLDIECVISELVEENEKELGKPDNPKEEQKGEKEESLYIRNYKMSEISCLIPNHSEK